MKVVLMYLYHVATLVSDCFYHCCSTNVQSDKTATNNNNKY